MTRTVRNDSQMIMDKMNSSIPPLDCRGALRAASRRLDGALAPESEVALAAHLAGCAACDTAARKLERTVLAVRAVPSERAAGAPAGLEARIMARVARDASTPLPVHAFAPRRLFSVAAGLLFAVLCGVGLLITQGAPPAVASSTGFPALGFNPDKVQRLLTLLAPADAARAQALLESTSAQMEPLRGAAASCQQRVDVVGRQNGRLDVDKLRLIVSCVPGLEIEGQPDLSSYGLDPRQSLELMTALKCQVTADRGITQLNREFSDAIRAMPLAVPTPENRTAMQELLPD